MKKWEKFSEKELLEIIQNSRSYREVAQKLGYNPDSGSGMKAIKDMIETKQFDISHFLGQGWNKNNFDYSRFQYGKNIKAVLMLDALINLRGRKCEKCGLTKWENFPIPLEVHHIDGDHLNNTLDNLQILCCNCHALTANFKGRNQLSVERQNEKVSEEQLVEALKTTSNVRQALLKVGLTSRGHNYDRAYDLIYKYQIKQQ